MDELKRFKKKHKLTKKENGTTSRKRTHKIDKF